MIVKRNGQFCLISKRTKKNLGCFSTRAGAVKRERQVQFFKRKSK